MLNIFVNTWGNYNENGADGGEWITLPMEPEELEEASRISPPLWGTTIQNGPFMIMSGPVKWSWETLTKWTT